MITQTIHHGDALAVLRSLPADSVHCIVTSPPYYGLRDYGVPGQIGMEPTIAAYVATMVEIFEECRRVLRPDGTLWLNLGDSYAGSGGAGEWSRRKAGKQEYAGPRGNNVNRTAHCGLKPKDLIGIPWRVAFALQEAGWWLRADIIWAKKAPMPESVTDRPTRSHEHIFLLAKSSRYYYDAEAVREEAAPQSIARIQHPNFDNQTGGPKDYGKNGVNSNRSMRKVLENFAANPGRNQRDVWELSPEPYPAAHFAVFPTEVPRRAILAGTSEKGCCPACGAPWKRVVDRTPMQIDHSRNHPAALRTRTSGTMLRPPSSITTGWQPGCICAHADPIPCTVLDPFLGSGTTLAVAASLGRAGIGIELNADYIELARQRIERQQLPLSLA